MLTFRRFRFMICLIAMSMAFQSCIFESDENCDMQYYVTLKIDNNWLFAPDATPEGMAYFFFPSEGGSPWRFDFEGKGDVEVRLPNDSYSFIMLNDDLKSVIFENDKNYDTMCVTTRECELLQGDDISKFETQPTRISAPDEEIRMNPDMIWSAWIPSVKIGNDMLTYAYWDDTGWYEKTTYSSRLILPTYPRCIVSRYHVRITDVSNLDGAARISGSLSGLAASVELADDTRSADAITTPIKMQKEDSTTIKGDFLTFGLPAKSGIQNVLSIYVWLSDGQRLSYEFDVTEQTIHAPNPLDVWINIKGLPLPHSEPASGAFDVNVDTWQTIVINF